MATLGPRHVVRSYMDPLGGLFLKGSIGAMLAS